MTRKLFHTAIAALAAALVLALAAVPAGAAERWSMRGAGWGHGIGMSQYGAYGFAKHGTGYRDIVLHYYTGTAIERRDGAAVRVLLQPNRSSISFRGGTTAGGRNLDEGSTYSATRSGSSVVLRSSTGRELERFDDVMTVSGGDAVKLLGRADNGVGDGLYRGSIDIRTAAGPGLNAINSVGLESYVMGVVGNESPSSWPAEALKAQAVAARTYALSSNAGGRGFNQYADTRSQVYRGYLSETPSTVSATQATVGQVVTYGGDLATTYFFSTSGGETENIENAFPGSRPLPWLKAVDDPYDNASPYHRWGPYGYTRSSLGARLGNWVKGRFRSLRIVQRGVSPRVVRARVVGTRGSTLVTGPQVRTRLGLRDTWFYVRRVRTRASAAAVQARTSSGARRLAEISGSITGAGDTVMLQRRDAGKWRTVMPIPAVREAGGLRYSIHVGRRGRYRVKAGWALGPALRVNP
jgi:stage II sporulation protein D